MSSLHSYPKVYAIGHRAVQELFLDPVLIEEKVDGSQISFGTQGGQLVLRSRGQELYVDNPEKMFAAGINAAKELASRLHDGWVYRGEYLAKPKHNVLAYNRVPRFNIILFDINIGDEVYLSREEKEAEAERIGMEIVPALYSGMVDNPEQLYSFLERSSVLGGRIEGIVVKNYSRFGADKKVLMGKYVSEQFKETHAKEWKASNPVMGDVIDRLIATLRNERRWEKAVERLRDSGELEHSPRDIGKLIHAVQKDVEEEEADFVAKKLTEWALPRVVRASSAGLPEWYKKRLVESAFNEQT